MHFCICVRYNGFVCFCYVLVKSPEPYCYVLVKSPEPYCYVLVQSPEQYCYVLVQSPEPYCYALVKSPEPYCHNDIIYVNVKQHTVIYNAFLYLCQIQWICLFLFYTLGCQKY
jgi:hypothetical protein